MLTRRIFAGCALCAVTATLTAAPVSAQPAAVKRTVVRQEDLPGTNHVTIQVFVDLEPNAVIGRHTHPGHEATYLVSGAVEISIEGQETLHLKPGDSFLVQAGVPHAGKAGPEATRLFATYVVEKGKPLSSPA
ncbi:cupin domain-containing protein [Acetobacteraceae bacterium H6797]|nr:cupin domain-containing protein [Acetobacteraceae bacterium H6797]